MDQVCRFGGAEPKTSRYLCLHKFRLGQQEKQPRIKGAAAFGGKKRGAADLGSRSTISPAGEATSPTLASLLGGPFPITPVAPPSHPAPAVISTANVPSCSAGHIRPFSNRRLHLDHFRLLRL
ncbi:hypothetical protein SAY86_006159 [Trapa natans]|uniref:Uncharacterized protein n=1 Tax=Trapa natans TaxID=22666 RepID=A0AAN7L443_TRANT|nr:hypothetical protein SAY86_006159 [Trapa natans]